MTVDPEEARALLADVAGIETRVRQILINANVGRYMQLWGVIWIVGFTANWVYPRYSGPTWWVLQAAGLAGTVAIVFLHHRDGKKSSWGATARAAASVLAIMLFGGVWMSIANMGWREVVTFWSSFLGFQIFLFGLWGGRAITMFGLGLIALTFTGYAVAGPYLHLWMAVAGGGAMLSGAWWLRR